MTSFDTPLLDVDFGHLLTGSNFSERPRVGDGDNDGKNDRENGGGASMNGSPYLASTLSVPCTGGDTLMRNHYMDGYHISNARPLRPRPIPPVAIYWWQVYPRECLAYTLRKYW